MLPLLLAAVLVLVAAAVAVVPMPADAFLPLETDNTYLSAIPTGGNSGAKVPNRWQPWSGERKLAKESVRGPGRRSSAHAHGRPVAATR